MEELNKMYEASKKASEEDARGEYESATLIEAAQCKNDEKYLHDIIRLVDQPGVNLNDKEDSSFTPIHWAVFKGNVDAVQYLYEHNADPTIVGGNGNTPFQQAAYDGHLAILQYFVEEANPPIISPINQNTYMGISFRSAGASHPSELRPYLEEHNWFNTMPGEEAAPDNAD